MEFSVFSGANALGNESQASVWSTKEFASNFLVKTPADSQTSCVKDSYQTNIKLFYLVSSFHDPFSVLTSHRIPELNVSEEMR